MVSVVGGSAERSGGIQPGNFKLKIHVDCGSNSVAAPPACNLIVNFQRRRG